MNSSVPKVGLRYAFYAYLVYDSAYILSLDMLEFDIIFSMNEIHCSYDFLLIEPDLVIMCLMVH